jgi:integrase
MARTPQPRFYESRKAWYATIAGKQYLLAKGKGGKAEAFTAFHRLMAEGACPAKRTELSVQLLLDLFVKASRDKVEPITHEGYVRRLQSFIDVYGASKAADVRPFHVQRWLDLHPAWNDSTRFGYVTAVKRAFNWAAKQGHLDKSPIADMDRPTMGRRTAVLTGEQVGKILEFTASKPRLRPFRDLLVGLWETGCRPSELRTLTADRVDLNAGKWTVINKTRRKTGEPTRIIMLTEVAVELSRRLVSQSSEGIVFRNHRGRPWTRNAMACNFDDARKALGYGAEVTAYAFRHRYATDALIGGQEIGAIATLLGHKSTTMIMRNYSHAATEEEFLRRAARAIRPGASLGAERTPTEPDKPPAPESPPQSEPGTTPDTPQDPPA